ncbi:hypothetical protein J0H58_18130 [bacterium]|nr:hypothetical protein [bacterium]
MHRPLLVAVLAALAPLGAGAQDGVVNPYKNVKVGDYATYTMSMKFGGLEVKGTVTNTIKAVTAKEATVEVTGTMNGMPIPPQTQKVDITKDFDPTAAGLAKNVKDAKVEKLAEGKEKLTIGDKSYEATWLTYKVTTKTPLGDVVGDVKAWVGKDIPLGLGKMEMSSLVNGMEMKMKMEQTEAGSKK